MTAGAELPVAVLGGGPAGSLLAILLARRGVGPIVFERDGGPGNAATGGRSINLALAARGIAALERAGVDAAIEPLLLPMRGRMLHPASGRPAFMRYGQHAGEQIYSVSRAALNEALREAAARLGVEYRFGHDCTGVDVERNELAFDTPRGRVSARAGVVFAVDGAGSIVRRALQTAGAVEARESTLDHGYMEFGLPPNAAGGFALEPEALHVWPRGGFMLIALPNTDRSFTATLFLPLRGKPSFESLAAGTVAAFFRREFPDALPLIHDVAATYGSRPVGRLGTIRCRPWHAGRGLLLIGDAAHAIVPFHGQGMNAAFEDCAELDRLIATQGTDWPLVIERFESQRIANTDAIARMALENYEEMRAGVRDPGFLLKRQLAFELERRFPGRFIPRYSMVMFHPEIPYAEAERRGRSQAAILDALTAGAASLQDIDFSAAERLIERQPG